MKKEVLPASAYRLLNPGCITLVTTHSRNRNNVMTASWQMPVSIKPPLVAIAIAKTHLTAEFIKESSQFTLNIPPLSLLSQAHYCGITPGRDRDKLKEAGLTLQKGKKVNAPVIEECIGNIECQLWNTYDGGDHYIFVAEVVAAVADESFENGWLFDKERKHFPVHHVWGNNYIVAGLKVTVLKGKEDKLEIKEENLPFG